MKLLKFITWPYRWVKEKIMLRKRMKELRRRDPFIYK
jgi:hypothetical protein